MITREEIRSIPKLEKDIENDIEHVKYLKDKAEEISSAFSDNEKIKSSSSCDGRAVKYIVEATDLQKQINIKANELSKLKSLAKEFIDTVPNYRTRRILWLRYIQGCTWESIEELSGYSLRWAQRIEYNAIKDL